jgi:glycine/D-amino acid oxidase-like deaminating enzyme
LRSYKKVRPRLPVICVIGAGFYGLSIAGNLASLTRSKVVVLEKAQHLGVGASWANQARVHGGYHYPRDLRTASRSREGLARFRKDFGESVVENFKMIYAISSSNSKTTASQFEAFCRRISAPFESAGPEFSALFSPDFIEAAYLVDEPAFNSDSLLDAAFEKAVASGVEVVFGNEVLGVLEERNRLRLSLSDGTLVQADYVLDCTYSSLGKLFEAAREVADSIKIERAEISLVEVPSQLKEIGVTVMDGPFFSVMPFPTRALHSFTHVTYTPRRTSKVNNSGNREHDTSAFSRMQADSARYMPILLEASHVSSIFTDKAVLISSEIDDARPILISESGRNGNYVSVLGSKIDTVYDAIQSVMTRTELRSLR